MKFELKFKETYRTETTYLVEADSLEEARVKVNNGDFISDDFDSGDLEIYDSEFLGSEEV